MDFLNGFTGYRLSLFCRLFLLSLLLTQVTACGGGSSDGPAPPVPPPSISSFTASETSIDSGSSLTLTAVFTNVSASIDNGVGSVSSNAANSISPSSTTTYTLTVTNSGGISVNAAVTITVISPSISSFTASPATSISGSAIILRAVFSNGTGTIDNGVGDVTSNVFRSVSPTTNTTYTLTVTNANGVSVTQTFTATVVPIILNVISPNSDQIVSDDLKITATVKSELDIAYVRAYLGSQAGDLVYSTNDEGADGFSGLLSLAGMTSGTYILTVIAEDVTGRSVFDERSILLDNNPELTVSEPIRFSVARPSIPISITCTDDAGDCDITVKVGNTLLASATNSLSDSLDLSSYNGQQISLKIQGKDSSNQITTETRTLFVESSTALANVNDFSGLIIDFDGQNALIKTSGDNGDSLSIVSISSSQVTAVEVPSGLTVSSTNSFLTTTGAMYSSREVRGNVLTSKIYDWNNGQLIDLGRTDSAVSLTVSGDYAIWSVARILWRRQLSTKTNIEISGNAGNWKNDIASNGIVGYWSYDNNYSIVRYDSGTNTTLASDSTYWNTYVESDGDGFMYRKHDRCCSGQQYAISYHDGINESVLTSYRDNEPSPGRDYQINNGWIAYTELGGLGQTHVWTRSSNGALLQHSIFGTDSTIDSLTSDGELMLLNSGKRYLSDATAQSTVVGSAIGKSSKVNGVWYIYIGRSLLKFNKD
jgi:hypothetical protein